MVLEKTLENPLDRKEIQPVHPEGNQPWILIERLMLKLNLHYFGHLMWRADSSEKTLMLGKIEGRRRKGRQRMRWLDGVTNPMDMSLGKLQSWWWTGRPGVLQSMGSQRVRLNWATKLNWTDSPNWSTDSAQSLYQNPSRIFASVDKLIWKFKWKCQGSFFLKMSKVEGLTLPNFQTYYKVIIIKTVVLA